MAKVVIDELVTLIGFQTTKESKQVVQSVENGIRSLKKLALVATGAMTGLAFAMDKIIGGIDKQAKFAQGLGVTFENLQRLQFADQKAGASISDVNGFVETLAKTMTSLQPGKFNPTLLRLNVAARDVNGNLRPLIPVILDVADSLSKLDAVPRQQFGAQLGASGAFTNVLGEGSKKILADMKEAERIGAVIPERLTKVVAAFFDDSLLKVEKTIKGITSVITVSFAPAASKLLNQFDEWIIKNKELVATNIGSFIRAASDGFVNFGKVMGVVSRGLETVVRLVTKTNPNLDKMSSVTFAVEASLLALAASLAILAAPFAALGTGVLLLSKTMPDWLEASKAVSTLYKTVFPSSFGAATDAINNTAKALERLFGLLGKLSAAKQVKFFAEQATEAFNLSKKDAGRSSIDRLVAQQEASGETGTPGNIFSKLSSTGGLSIPGRNASTAGNTTNNSVNIEVNGAGSPASVAKEVKSQFDLATAVQVSSPGFNRPTAA